MRGRGRGRGFASRGVLSPPNPDDMIRRFKTQEDNILIDSISSNDGEKIKPVSTVLSTSIAEFTDLSGITITSYSGDQLLSISGNNIISSGTGFVFDLLLSDGTLIPFLHLKTDVSGNENHILNITDISLGYDINGSSYLQDKGVVERNPELVENSDFSDGLTGWSVIRGAYAISNNTLIITHNNAETSTFFRNTTLPPVVGGKNYSLKITMLNESETNVTLSAFINNNLQGGYEGNSVVGTVTMISSNFTASENGSLDIRVNTFGAASGGGVVKFYSVCLELATPEIIPNTPTGQAAYPIVSGDTFIAGGGMMNLTDCLVRLYEVGDTDPAKLFFDLSNTLIWNDRARQDYYDTLHTGDVHTSILKQAELYLTFEAASKYRLWSKILSNGVFKDIFLYANQLTEPALSKAIKYVGVTE